MARVAYDGTDFSGFQRQKNERSVQGELEKTLTRMNGGQFVDVQGAGRTDAGVHAADQVIHFDLPQRRDEEKLRFALDTQTPEDVSVSFLKEVAQDWHARYQPHEKTYVFYLQTGKPRSPFKRRYASYFPYPLDVDKMQEAMQALVGKHDFTGFTATGGSVEDKVRIIYEANLQQEGDMLSFTFRGNGFLYKQIRNMIGTLIKIGNGKFPEERIQEILASGNRQLAGPTAHPEGLFLKEVRYL